MAAGEAPRGPSAQSGASASEGIAWKTAALVTVMIAVWAVGLALDAGSRPDLGGTTFQSSPSARLERRPALFAITWNAGTNAGPGAVGVATPIALIEPGGAIVPPIAARSDEDAAAEARTFAATYYRSSTGLLLLRGGAAAGDVRFVGDPMLIGNVPVAPVAGSSPVDHGPLDIDSTTLLAISDWRFAGRAVGTRAMRDVHRGAADVAMRQILRDRYPKHAVATEGVARVRVADLDRDGRTEVLASRHVRLRDDAGRMEGAILFVIMEPRRSPAPGESAYRVAFVAAQVYAETGPPFDIVFVDQADLTVAAYDEVILRLDDGDASRYAVIRRDQTAWSQVSSTRPMRSLASSQLPGEKAGG